MADEKTSCVLRLFGAQPGQLAGAVGQFLPQWQASAQWKSRGGETLLALQAASPAGLKKAAQSLRARLPDALYGAGDTSLAAAAVDALERHNKLLVCADAAAGALLEQRLETVPGAEKVYDFGAVSYAHPKTGPLMEKRARQRLERTPGREDDPARGYWPGPLPPAGWWGPSFRQPAARGKTARRSSSLPPGRAAGCAPCPLGRTLPSGCWTSSAGPQPGFRRRRVLPFCLPIPSAAGAAEPFSCCVWQLWPSAAAGTPRAGIGSCCWNCPAASGSRAGRV